MKTRKMKKLRNKFLLKSLLLIALSNEKLSIGEKKFLQGKAVKFNLTEKDLRKIVSHPEKLKAIIPDDLGERIDMLYELVSMVLRDGIITPEELNICHAIAEKLEVIPNCIEQIIKDLERKGNKAAA